MQAQVVLYTPHPHRHHSPRQKFAVLFHLFIVENNSLALAVICMYHTRHRLNSHTPSHISKHHKWRNIIQLFYLVYRFHRSTRKLINLTAPHPSAPREQLSPAVLQSRPPGMPCGEAPPANPHLGTAQPLHLRCQWTWMPPPPSLCSPNQVHHPQTFPYNHITNNHIWLCLTLPFHACVQAGTLILPSQIKIFIHKSR